MDENIRGCNHDEFHHILPDGYGNFILSGRTYSVGAGWFDGWSVKVDVNGNDLWNKTYGGSGKETINSGVRTTSNEIFYAGQKDYDYSWIFKTDSLGNYIAEKTFGYRYIVFLSPAADINIIFAGTTKSYGPNPFNPTTTIQLYTPKHSDIKLQVYNISGQLVQSNKLFNLPQGEPQLTFEASGLPTGIYFYRIRSDLFKSQQMEKMM